MNLFTDYIHCNINEELADYLYPISKKILSETPEHPSYINGKTSYFFRSTPSQYGENLFPFYDYVLKNSIEYLKTLEVDIEKYNLEFKNIWFSEMYKFGSHDIHAHYNNDLSGNFYIHCEEKSSPITFLKTDFLYGMMTDVDFTEYNCFNSTAWRIPPEKGKLLMWQSNLLHKVDTNLSNSRITVSFNLKIIKK